MLRGILWLRSTFFALLLPGTAVVWIPLWLSTRSGGRLDIGLARWVGMPVVLAGTVGLLWCIWEFAHEGQGTLAPVDAPRFIVRGGLYRWVRNPMYVSVITVLLGEALVFRSSWLLAWAGLAALVFHLFVLMHEEPALRRRFGSEYETYCGRVPRWLPRRPR